MSSENEFTWTGRLLKRVGSVSESSRPPPAPRKKPDVPLLKRAPRGSITPLAQGVRALPSRRILGFVRTVKSWVDLPTRAVPPSRYRALFTSTEPPPRRCGRCYVFICPFSV